MTDAAKRSPLRAVGDRVELLFLSTEAPAAAESAVIFVAYDVARSVDALRIVDTQLSTFTHPIPVVVVANSDATWEHFQSGGAHQVLRGSNAEAEFSGYDEGTVHLLKTYEPQSLFLLNDRAFSYDGTNQHLLRPSVARVCGGRGWAAGTLDTLPALGDRPGACYLRSNFLCLPRSAWSLRSTWRTSRDAAELPPEHQGPEWWAGTKIDTSYAKYLTRWLTGTGERGSWYQAEPLTASSWPVFRGKVRSILYEHSLSATLESSGVALVNAQRLAVAARGGADLTPIERWAILPRWSKLHLRCGHWVKCLAQLLREVVK